MILLDTDHLSLLKYPEHDRYDQLMALLGESGEEIGTTIISVEEQFRGWMALLSKQRDVRRQTRAYAELLNLFSFFSGWTILPFDERAAEEFERLRSGGVRIAGMDLKIAAVALVHDALLLSANKRDFEKVPGLRVENWLV